MLAHVYSNGKHQRLHVEVADLEELIMRCGWTVVHDIEGMTDADRAEIARLDSLPCISGLALPTREALEWWQTRLIDSAPTLTPDM